MLGHGFERRRDCENSTYSQRLLNPVVQAHCLLNPLFNEPSTYVPSLMTHAHKPNVQWWAGAASLGVRYLLGMLIGREPSRAPPIIAH